MERQVNLDSQELKKFLQIIEDLEMHFAKIL